jgi:hypothetical protein
MADKSARPARSSQDAPPAQLQGRSLARAQVRARERADPWRDDLPVVLGARAFDVAQARERVPPMIVKSNQRGMIASCSGAISLDPLLRAG